MATIYMPVGYEVEEMIRDRIKSNEPDLERLGIRIKALFARAQHGSHAVKMGGVPFACSVKIIPQRDRIGKEYDAEIVIDERAWGEMREPHRRAVIAHALRRISVVRKLNKVTQTVDVVREDDGRPKLKLRQGDWYASTGFVEIVQEFKDFAPEMASLQYAVAMSDAAKRGQVEAPKPGLFDLPMLAASSGSDLWMDVKLTELIRHGAYADTVRLLADGPIDRDGFQREPVRTLGERAALAIDGGCLSAFRGIGPSAAEAFGLAEISFWAHWNNGGEAAARAALERGSDSGAPRIAGNGTGDTIASDSLEEGDSGSPNT